MSGRRAVLVLAFAAVAGLAAWTATYASRHPWTTIAIVLVSPFILRTAARDLRQAVRRLRRRSPDTQVRLRGEIDDRSAERTTRLLTIAIRHTEGALDIDLTRVTSISRGGAAALLNALRTARTAGIPVTVHGANPQVRETLHSLGLDHLLNGSPDGDRPS